MAQTAAPARISDSSSSGRTANTGAAATFTVVATGAPLTYQWQFGGANIGGATGASYTLPSVLPANAGVYDVVVTNSIGSTTSANASLLVYSPYVVSILAGQTLTTGSVDGTGTAARFDNPAGVAVDGSGNLYVVDTVNCTIRKIAPRRSRHHSGRHPRRDRQCRWHRTGRAIQLPDRNCSRQRGQSLRRGHLQQHDPDKITPAGVVTTLAGLAPTAANPSPTNTGSANGSHRRRRPFQFSRGVAVDGAGNVYVSPTPDQIASSGKYARRRRHHRRGQCRAKPTESRRHRHRRAFRLSVWDRFGQFRRPLGGRHQRPDHPIRDPGRRRHHPGRAGRKHGQRRRSGERGAVWNNPAGIAIDGAGNLYIADTNNSTIREITTDGVVATLAGLAGNGGSVNASGSSARFLFPFAIAVDGAGNLYIADTYNAQIRIASAQSQSQFAPTIQTQPASQTVNVGSTAVLSISASGNPSPTYQWFKAGVPIPGATNPILTLNNVQTGDAAGYSATATNAIGSVTSSTATLSVAVSPVITAAPQSQSLNAGANAVLSVTGSGASSYQWQLNGVNLAGATSATLALGNIGTNQAGIYTVVLTNSAGSVTSAPATVTVSYNARLTNLSARANAATGANFLSAGFVVSGSGSKKILVRGVGPTLTEFAIASPLVRPQLGLYDAVPSLIAMNVGWGNAPTAGPSSVAATVISATASVMSSVGAFALPAGSADCAMLATLPGGSYSTEVSGVSGSTGIALAELYDTDAAGSASRLANISARANVGVGANVLTAGFVVAGTTSETVLLRGVGPGLAAFGLTGLLAQHAPRRFPPAAPRLRPIPAGAAGRRWPAPSPKSALSPSRPARLTPPWSSPFRPASTPPRSAG